MKGYERITIMFLVLKSRVNLLSEGPSHRNTGSLYEGIVGVISADSEKLAADQLGLVRCKQKSLSHLKNYFFKKSELSKLDEAKNIPLIGYSFRKIRLLGILGSCPTIPE